MSKDKKILTEIKPAKPKPNESGQILVDEFIKIYDPETGEVLVEKRES